MKYFPVISFRDPILPVVAPYSSPEGLGSQLVPLHSPHRIEHFPQHAPKRLHPFFNQLLKQLLCFIGMVLLDPPSRYSDPGTGESSPRPLTFLMPSSLNCRNNVTPLNRQSVTNGG